MSKKYTPIQSAVEAYATMGESIAANREARIKAEEEREALSEEVNGDEMNRPCRECGEVTKHEICETKDLQLAGTAGSLHATQNNYTIRTGWLCTECDNYIAEDEYYELMDGTILRNTLRR